MKASFIVSIILLLAALSVNAQHIQSPVVMNPEYGKASLNKEERLAIRYARVGRRSPGLAFALSALVPGAGQFYNKQPVKGGILLGSTVVGYGLVMSSIADMFDYYSNSADQKALAGVSLIMISWLVSVIDAPLSAKAINRKYQLDVGYRQMNGYIPTGGDSGYVSIGVNIPIGKTSNK